MDVMSINIHRMFEYLFCADESSSFLNLRFENDVKMYGTQTTLNSIPTFLVFENDVKMYGTQTHTGLNSRTCLFENDVKMYGTQTGLDNIGVINEFENDVKMYGTQTLRSQFPQQRGLRMM